MPEYISPEGLKKLKEELDYLRNHKRKEIAARLKRTAEFGDLSENAAYHEAKEAKNALEDRIRELEKIIGNAVVIEGNKDTNVVSLGSIVEVSSGSKKMKFEIVGKHEADPLSGKISYASPLGKSLLKKKKGAVVEIETPRGKVKYKIISIHH